MQLYAEQGVRMIVVDYIQLLRARHPYESCRRKITEITASLKSLAEALTDVTLYAISRADFLRLLDRCPELATVVLRNFATRLAHLTQLVADLSLRTVRARLARFLLEQSEAEAPVRWTHAEIAAYIGTVRVVVSRTLRDFAAEGILNVQRQRIAVADRDALIREAKTL
jgi:CRP-like cAMP-binding protein